MSGKTVDELVRELEHPDPLVRRDASAELVALLGDTNLDVGHYASVALRDALLNEKRRDAALSLLIRSLEAGSLFAKLVGTRALREAAEKGACIYAAFPSLLRALQSEQFSLRANASGALVAAGPRGYDDLKTIASLALLDKKEGKPVGLYAHVYSSWMKALAAKAEKVVADKKFHIPEVKKPDGVERVLRVRRVNA